MALNFAGATTLTAAGVAVASLDASGILTNSNTPMVLATQSGTGTAVGSDVIFNNIGYNVGNCYNATNGRFTASVAGVYHVMWGQLAQNAASASNFVFGVYINGTIWLPSYSTKQAIKTWNSNSYRTHVYLNAGDYITIRYVSGNQATYTNAGYAMFSVCLVQ